MCSSDLELKVGGRCILKRVTTAKDGKPFKYWGGEVYLDEIHYFNFDADNQLNAFASGDVVFSFGGIGATPDGRGKAATGGPDIRSGARLRPPCCCMACAIATSSRERMTPSALVW